MRLSLHDATAQQKHHNAKEMKRRRKADKAQRIARRARRRGEGR